MGQRLVDYPAPDAKVSSSGIASTDPWIIEVLLDTLAVALRLPLRLVITPRLECAFAPGEPLGEAIRKGFGDDQTFRKKLEEVAADACKGLRTIGNDPVWNGVAKEVNGLRAIITSNSDPFWTVMRGLEGFSHWEICWLLRNTPAGTEHVEHMPAPFGDDFIVCKGTTPKFAMRLEAGPVWDWVPVSSGEPGMAPSGEAAVERIVRAFADHIRRQVEGGQVSIFSRERLTSNTMSRPPTLSTDVCRRVRLSSRALEHALCVETTTPPKAVELVSIALAALHLAERLDEAPAYFGPCKEVWHLLETGRGAGSDNAVWLTTRLANETDQNEGALSILQSVSPPSEGPTVRLYSPTSDSASLDQLGFGRVIVDYAAGRSAYIRERLTIIRLWVTDNFASWLTTSNLPERIKYTERVDVLAQRISDVFVADRCSIFRYDAEKRTLDRLGHFARDQPNDNGARVASSQEIREVGFDLDRRSTSPRYLAIDTASPVHLTEYRDAPSRVGGQRRGSRLVVPIVIFGRPWGTIELVGFRPDQFAPSTTPWLRELSGSLGPDLYIEGMLNDLHEISKSVLAEKPKHEQFRDVLGHLARIFVAGSGALYLRHPRRTAEFVRVAHFGRPADLPDGELSGFNVDDPVPMAAAIVRAERKEWIAGAISVPPFDAEWQTRSKTHAWGEQGYRFVAIMSMRDRNDRVVGCITLAGREGGPFEERFRPLAEFATRHADIAIEAIELKHQPNERARELMAHSLKTRVDRVMGALDTFQRLLVRCFGGAGNSARLGTLLRDIEHEAARNRWAIDGPDRRGREILHRLQSVFDASGQNAFATVLEDIRLHTSDLRRTAAFLAGDIGNVENPYETTEAQWSGTPTALRDCLLGCVMSVARHRGIEVATPPPQELGGEVRIRVSPLVISDIINNFCDNALKYSAPGAPIRIRFRWRRGGPAYLDFRNLAPELTDAECAKLGKTVFRSEYALSRSSDGQGRGLLSNRKLAERWRMRVVHRQEPTETWGGVNVWHVFGLEIPADLIFEDSTQRPFERGPRS